jgi:HAD superfamily hydrolase (TIGR01509 family)
MTIKALIFDFDGLILDTETPEYQALNTVYREFGQHLPIEMYGRVVGSQYNQQFEPLSHLEALLGKPLEPDIFWERVNRHRMELINQNPLLPGVEPLIRAAKAAGLKLAVASSSSHAWVEGHLQRFGLLPLFDVVKCKEDVGQIKPAPDLFLAALEALHLQPQEAVILEDSSHGVTAAGLAGIRVVLIPNSVTQHLKIEGETLRLASLADLPLAALLQQLHG